jgi:outer membrane protein assembly factor BamB
MRIYFEKGDRVTIPSNPIILQSLLQDWFTDRAGRDKVVTDIMGSAGVIYAVSENEGHIQALYMKDGTNHSWKLPVTVFELPAPLMSALEALSK